MKTLEQIKEMLRAERASGDQSKLKASAISFLENPTFKLSF